MRKNDTLATIAIIAGLLALTFFIYNYFDVGKIDYRALAVSIVSFAAAFLFSRGTSNARKG